MPDTTDPSRPDPWAVGTAAVILAGGLSSRMLGPLKPLLPLAGQTALARLAATLRHAGVTDIVVAGGHRHDEIAAEAARLGLRFVYNPYYETGMFSTVRAALAVLPPTAAQVLITPADVPLFRPATVVRLLGRAGAPDAPPVLYPSFAGERGHPPCLDATLAPAILAYDGDGGLRAALAPYPFEELPVADALTLADMDTPDDYAVLDVLAGRLDIPTPAEAEALLAIEAVPPQGLAHARGVAAVAVALTRGLNAAGAGLDCELIEAAALLHDVAKGQPHHEAAGGRLLDALGFSRAGAIVAAHRDIDLPPQAPVTEREIVYLADKFVHGSRLVSVPERFGQKLALFAHDPEAVAAITRRRSNALAILARVERALPRPLADILATTGLTPARQP
ncbi:NTP transferase domain-containing protein [Desulfovibrio aerotolerans]|uniref:NTP transferase domain-containing protein n=1 Tax=Solidesulfovibrio aerotolerans TaxID=295255 RepID=A0A7C9IP46_9BACT|nr:NTP transferase domain-containing protein [Solidesulfovibrio aerotolerans]MYL83699.1 NTP transferase domain-containing protein [Solidesulfovibrio aerotolerans]